MCVNLYKVHLQNMLCFLSFYNYKWSSIQYNGVFKIYIFYYSSIVDEFEEEKNVNFKHDLTLGVEILSLLTFFVLWPILKKKKNSIQRQRSLLFSKGRMFIARLRFSVPKAYSILDPLLTMNKNNVQNTLTIWLWNGIFWHSSVFYPGTVKTS